MEICGKGPNCGVAMRPPEETITWEGGSTHWPLSLRRALTRMARRTPSAVGTTWSAFSMMRSAATPAGRESKFGERTWRASRSTPLEESTCKSSSTSGGLGQIICDNRSDMNGEL